MYRKMASSSIAKIVCGVLLVLCYAQLGLATDYFVGDKAGWNPKTDYSAWISGKTFHVGDRLVFLYDPGHDVAEVDLAAFSICDASHPLWVQDSGNTWVALAAVGQRFFISTAQDDCRLGMALGVYVTKD